MPDWRNCSKRGRAAGITPPSFAVSTTPSFHVTRIQAAATHRLTIYLDLYPAHAARCALRFHISIESDRDRLPGLPPPASFVERRFEAAAELHAAGLRVVI